MALGDYLLSSPSYLLDNSATDKRIQNRCRSEFSNDIAAEFECEIAV